MIILLLQREVINLSDLIPSPVLLALIENKVSKTNDKISSTGREVNDAGSLTDEEKNDIIKNNYDFIIDKRTGFVYHLQSRFSDTNWYYSSVSDTEAFSFDANSYRSVRRLFGWELIKNTFVKDAYNLIVSHSGVAVKDNNYFTSLYKLKQPNTYRFCSIPKLVDDMEGSVKICTVDCVLGDSDEIGENNYINLKANYRVSTDTNGNVVSTPLVASLSGNTLLPDPASLTLVSDKYPGTMFYANYYSNTSEAIVYHFSSGIMLDSSTETSQYKIVFASYDVKAAKVTFVEKMLS